MIDVAIRVRNLGKQYRIGQYEHHKTLRDAIVRAAKAPFAPRSARGAPGGPDSNRHEYIWALRNISFDVEKGEVVGIIGRNGAGKSTLLKVLSRITEPTEGLAEIRGRVGCLLEVGTGFHPELTGRENIYLNGAILGMRRAEIERKFDEIVAFSEIEKFLDTPVKRYSSGMYVRLAFSVAAHLEPEILLVDEVLAVGDIGFQRKCLGKMEDVTEEGRTVLFVSHNMASIQALTEKAICLDGGQIIASGETDSTVQEYLRLVDSRTPRGSVDLSTRKAKVLRSVEVLQMGRPVSVVGMGTPLTFRMTLSSREPLTKPSIGFHIESETGVRVVSLNTRFDLTEAPAMLGDWVIVCDAGTLPLNHGRFYVKAALSDGGEEIDEIEGACKFDVVAADVFGTGRVPAHHQGRIYWQGHWKFENASEPASR